MKIIILKILAIPLIPFVAWMTCGMSAGTMNYFQCLAVVWEGWWQE